MQRNTSKKFQGFSMATTTEDESTAGDNVRRSPRRVTARRRKAKGNNNAHTSEQSPFFVKTDEEEMEEEENGAAPAHALADSTQKAPTGTLNGHASANGSNDPQLAAALATPLLTELPSSKRIRDFTVRFVWTWLMLGGFFLVLAYGPFAVSLLVLGVQILVFREVIAIAHVPNKEKKLPWFRALNWFFLLVTNYYLYGETMFTHFQRSVTVDAFLQPLATHHRFVSFILYCVLLIYFVMNLKKGHYKFQFLQFFWTHMTLLVVVLQSHFIISSIFEGLIWFLLPVLLVVTNDIMAYVGGFFFGKTRLIKLSPKKTWEGFLFGFFCTLVFSVIFTRIFIKYPYLTCPVKDLHTNIWSQVECPTNPAFIPVAYQLSPALQSLARHIGLGEMKHVMIPTVIWHALAMAVFASIIAPFGGFFASGFKRAFKMKDFGVSIPGHGGLTDRMDCQLIMGVFSYMYYTTFIKMYEPITVDMLLGSIVDGLNPNDQLELYHSLHDYLKGQGII